MADFQRHLESLRGRKLAPLEEYIYGSRLREQWLKEIVPILQRKEALQAQLRETPRRSLDAGELRAEIARLEREYAGWEAFAGGRRGAKSVGDLMPDEYFIRLDAKPSAGVGDPSLAYTNPLHNFKSQLTGEILRDVTGIRDVVIYDWRSSTRQTIIELPP